MVAWWSALLPYSKKVLGWNKLQTHVEFAFSPHACGDRCWDRLQQIPVTMIRIKAGIDNRWMEKVIEVMMRTHRF